MIRQLIFLLISVVLFSAVTGENCPPDLEIDSEDEACKCGKANHEYAVRGRSKKILNGREVRLPIKYPWMVSIYRGKNFLCAGSLIGKAFVLAAAQCFLHKEVRFVEPPDWPEFCSTSQGERVRCFQVESFQVVYSGEETTGRKIHELKRVTTHPQYNLTSLMYDIAVIELKEPIECSPYIRPICLPTFMPRPRDGREAIVAGWAYYDGPLRVSEQLLEKKVYLQTEKKCDEYYPGFKTHICAIGLRQSVCMGVDEGSSLFLAATTYEQTYFIYGISSFHKADESKCNPATPHFYTNIWKFFGWIFGETCVTEKTFESTPSNHCVSACNPDPNNFN